MIQFVDAGPETGPKKKPKIAATTEVPDTVAPELSAPERAAKSPSRKTRRVA